MITLRMVWKYSKLDWYDETGHFFHYLHGSCREPPSYSNHGNHWFNHESLSDLVNELELFQL